MSDPKTVGEGIDVLCEVCERYVRCVKDEGGRGMATWMLACASLMREMMTALAAVWPDGPLTLLDGTCYAIPKERIEAAKDATARCMGGESYRDANVCDCYAIDNIVNAVLTAALNGEVLPVEAVGYLQLGWQEETPYLSSDPDGDVPLKDEQGEYVPVEGIIALV